MMRKAVANTPAKAPRPGPLPEPVTRLASLRHSLRLVEPFGHGPADDIEPSIANDRAIASALKNAAPGRRERFDRRSRELVSSAGAGLQAMLAEMAAGNQPNEEAAQELSNRIRRELAEIAGLVLR